MKHLKHLLAFVLLMVAGTSISLADSPLTSTEWWKYYEKKEVVRTANEYGCTTEVLNCLVDDKMPLDLRLAIVNAMGWNINGQGNVDLFVQHLTKKKGKSALKKASAETLCVMAYLKALDNYFEVDEALEIASQAYRKKPTSRGIAMIYGLIGAQKAMDDDWGEVYSCVAKFAYDKSLTRDMSDYAVEQIMEYIDLYKGY